MTRHDQNVDILLRRCRKSTPGTNRREQDVYMRFARVKFPKQRRALPRTTVETWTTLPHSLHSPCAARFRHFATGVGAGFLSGLRRRRWPLPSSPRSWPSWAWTSAVPVQPPLPPSSSPPPSAQSTLCTARSPGGRRALAVGAPAGSQIGLCAASPRPPALILIGFAVIVSHTAGPSREGTALLTPASCA